MRINLVEEICTLPPIVVKGSRKANTSLEPGLGDFTKAATRRERRAPPRGAKAPLKRASIIQASEYVF